MKTQDVRRLWEKFPVQVQLVQQDHITQKAFASGHNFYHALMVAQYALSIAEDERIGELAWIAGIIHNTDRLFPNLGPRGVGEKVRKYLERGFTGSSFDADWIVEAVLDHSKKNDPSDNQVTVTLKDADRLLNIGPYHWLGAAQFRWTILPVDPRFILTSDTTATFKDPKSILQDIKHTLEWESWLRLPKAQALGKPKFDAIRWYIAQIESQFDILGLLPFPEELVVTAPS